MLNRRPTLWDYRGEMVICLLLATATSTYVIMRTWQLGSADEAYYYYHAIRMLEGEVLYRDVFELTTPFFVDLLALSFHFFDATFATGRAFGSAVQALLIVVIYLGARIFGANRALAVGAALVQLSIAQPAWPYTTPHWLAIFFVCVLLLLSIDRRKARTTRRVLLQGFILGLLVATRQHAGVAVGIGMTLLIFIDALSDRLWGQEPGLPLTKHVLTFAAATLFGSSVIMVPHLIQAGVGPMISQLVVHPLTGYRDTNQVTWGTNYLFNLAPFTWPDLLRYLPLVVAATAVRAAVAMLRRHYRRRTESLIVLTMFGGAALTYTMSFPDLIHLAMIMPALLIIAVELLTWILGFTGRFINGLQTVLGIVLIIACLAQLQRNYTGGVDQYPIRHDTDFGTLPFANAGELDAIAWVKDELEQEGSPELLIYPGWASMYLMSGARNPTRHDLIFPGYQSNQEITELIDTLENKRVRQVLLVKAFVKDDDPVNVYVRQHYRCSEEPLLQLCKRRAE